MSKEKLKQIFIEEANEIIEKLDVDIIDFEQNPNDKNLINELFRGVHTLKGNANAFGFTRLGSFVHHLEDLLDHYRSSPEEISTPTVDLMLEAVDVIKEVKQYEVDGQDGVPDEYEPCLQKIIENLNKAEITKEQVIRVEPSILNLADEFLAEDVKSVDECEHTVAQQLNVASTSAKISSKFLYLIELTLDKDIYFRGYDHLIFLKQLTDIGTILESYWNCQNVPALEHFSASDCYFGSVSILFESDEPITKVEDIFEFLFDNEWSIRIVSQQQEEAPKVQQIAVVKEAPKVEVKPVVKQPVNNNDTKAQKSDDSGAKSYIKIDTAKLDELFDSVGELVIAQNFIAQNERIHLLDDSYIQKTIETLSKITKVIQDRVMSLRMVAIKDTFERMKRVARDTAKKTGKEINFVIQGEETEIDKTMIDSLSDPIVHMIRNAIDHGLEDNSIDRVSVDKDGVGQISLRAYHKNGSIVIAISDDGRGINKEKVLSKAIERGIVSSSESLSDSQIFGLIMQPGFSTADKISDISGRGVGLDVVKTSIEKLRGKVDISSELGKGSTFSIILPLTLAIIDGMLVKSSNEIFIIPTLAVVESFMPDRQIVHMMKGRGEFVNLRGEHIPVIRLNHILELSNDTPNIWESTLVCVESDRGRFAVLVDELMGRQQVVIKTLGKTLSKIKEISGGAILGNGDIALIVNIDGLCSESITTV
ncbi:MAG: hypothetical protein RL154_831 [Pseudomonadota bacterium]|jgi:two-component system chemotaxis sensor kinase CheA